MSFSVGLLLIPYGIAVILFLIFALLNVYHLIAYGATTKVSFLFTFVFLAGSSFIAYASWLYLKDIDWSAQIMFQLMQAGAFEGF